jgi:hypothetical protein
LFASPDEEHTSPVWHWARSESAVVHAEPDYRRRDAALGRLNARELAVGRHLISMTQDKPIKPREPISLEMMKMGRHGEPGLTSSPQSRETCIPKAMRANHLGSVPENALSQWSREVD